MLLLIQVFPAPISAVTKEAVSNQWAQSWETGTSPTDPFDPPGTGLPSGTWRLKTLSRPAPKLKSKLACLASHHLEGKHWCCLHWGRKGDRQESLTEAYWEKESRVDVLFSLWNYRSKTGQRGKAEGGCGPSRRGQTCILPCVCPLGSVTHTSPWLNRKACARRADRRWSLYPAAEAARASLALKGGGQRARPVQPSRQRHSERLARDTMPAWDSRMFSISLSGRR